MITNKIGAFPLFSWPLMRAILTDVDAENQYIKSLIDVEGEFRANTFNLIGTDTYILDRPELAGLRADIQRIAEEYAFKTLAYKDVTVELTQSWINVSRKGDQHPAHSHPNVVIAGCYYPDGCPGAPLAFHNPNKFQIVPNTDGTNKDPMSMISRPVVFFQANPGEILLWLAPMTHSVLENTGTEDRFSLAFNFVVRGEMGHDESLDKVIY